MPIQSDSIELLIKTTEKKQLDNWKKDYFKRIAEALQVHTKGQLFSKVDTLFPNEHPDSKAHCIATYEPITKSSIWKGINNILRIFSSSSFSINVGEELQKFLEEYEFNGYSILNFFLQEWVHKAIAEDPNGLFVIYPPDYAAELKICPVQWVRSDLIKHISQDAVSFISESQSEVEYDYETTSTHRHVYYDETIDALNARTYTQTTYNSRLAVKVKKEVVHLFTREGLIVYKKNGKIFETTIIQFPDQLTQVPVFSGGGMIADRADQALFESFVQPFVPFGNLALIQHRNHRAVDLTFSYPRMSEIQIPCDHKGCSKGIVKCTKSETYPDGYMPCPTCKGKSWVTVQSPYKIYQPRYDPNDTNDNAHLKVDPVKFYSPDVGIINYSKDAWKDYLKIAEQSIFIQYKRETGNVESVEAKDRDLDELYAWLLGVSKVFYNNLRMTLQCLEDYLSRSPMPVSVEQPYSFAILTEGEAFVALNNILMSNAPIFVKANRVENFVNKFVSKDSPVNRALEVLKQYDPLLFYSNSEVSSFKAQNGVSPELLIKHIYGYPTFLKLYTQDKAIVDKTDEQIIALMDKEIKALNITQPAENFRANILKAVEAA